MSVGWICLHRNITEHWIWSGEPFTRGQAWIDLLLKANFAQTKILFNGQFLTLEDGSFVTSIIKLSACWSWSVKKVRAFLQTLEDDGMIMRKSDNKKTIIHISNWTMYQDDKGTAKGTAEEQQKNSERTTKETSAQQKNSKKISEEFQRNFEGISNCPQDNKDNKGNKGNKGNKEREGAREAHPSQSRFIPPCIEEVMAYCVARQNDVDAQAFCDFYSSKGWMVGSNKMKDWRAAVRTWEKRNFGSVAKGSGNPFRDMLQELEERERNESERNDQDLVFVENSVPDVLQGQGENGTG